MSAIKYRKKPVVIEAMQMPTDGHAYSSQVENQTIAEWIAGCEFDSEDDDFPDFGSNFIEIETLEGTMTGGPGDFIIKGVQGEFYPCKPDVFAATYEVA